MTENPSPNSASLEAVRFDLPGLHCAGCVGRVERALAGAEGVDGAQVNLATRQAFVRFLPERTDADKIADVLSQAGYPGTLVQDRTAEQVEAETDREIARAWRKTIVAAVLSFPVVLIEMGSHASPALHHWLVGTLGKDAMGGLSFILTTLVLIGPGRDFFTIGFRALRRGAPEMNSLVALGAGAAWLFSTVTVFAPQWVQGSATQGLYFEAAALIVTLILLGRALEARARGSAGRAIRALGALQVPEAERVSEDGTVAKLPLSAILSGDRLLVRPHTRVPADGIVLTGESHVDESMLTGESIPISKAAGETVTGGSLNGEGLLEIETTAVGAESRLAQIVGMIEDAQASKLPVQSSIDRVTSIFVPVVLAVAMITFTVWAWQTGDVALALSFAISVLIVACPCAMGLATPLSVLVSTGRAAGMGVFVRQGDAFQRLSKARHVAFDKTGTLTEGRPKVIDVEPGEGAPSEEVLALAASLAKGSDHPLSRAISNEADARGLSSAQAEVISSVSGAGMIGSVGGSEIRLGSRALLEAADIEAPLGSGTGRSTVHVAKDGSWVGLIEMADSLRGSAAPALKRLSGMGLSTSMISGDLPAVAKAVAAPLPLDRVIGGTPPEGKAEVIKELGDGVVFVGDGVNDGPALATADVGIAMGGGAEAALETADVALLGDELGRIPSAIALSRATLRNIHQNLFWAFGYNTLLIPVAAGVFWQPFGIALVPAFSAAAMSLSSVLVATNALRLRRVPIDQPEHSVVTTAGAPPVSQEVKV